MMALMESDPTYQGHNCHTHHYHDPCWAATFLVYVDEDSGGHPGTTLHGVEGDAAWTAAQTLQWFDMGNLPIARTADYRANRMLAFLESPISFHSAAPAAAGATGRRRILRVHVAAAADVVKRVYGVSLFEYRTRRRRPTDDPEVISWLARDITELETVSTRGAKAI